MQDIRDLLWMPNDTTFEEGEARIVRAMDLFESISPTDGIEATLALQMVGAHQMQCLRAN